VETSILVALLAALVTALGWLIAYRFTRLRDDRLRSQELRVKHLERQIAEFYGPLHRLVEQIMVTNEVQESVLSRHRKTALSPEEKARVRRLLHNDYFRPLHDQIATILRTKLYLVEGVALPDSFYKYLRHTNQERVQADLWQKEGLDTSHVPGHPWPDAFPVVIRAGLDRLMAEYERLMLAIGQAPNRGTPPVRDGVVFP
jgi:hypothetical protein